MYATIYTRFSPRPTKDGDAERIAAQEDDESIQVQLAECQRYCDHKQLQVVRILKDPETSARTTPLFERPEGQLLRDVPKGHHIVCLDIDRMFRETADGLITSRYFTKQGVHLHFANQGGNSIDASTADGELFLTIRLGFASYEPRKIAERTSRGMKHRQHGNQRMTRPGYEPYGKMVDPQNPDQLIDNPEEAALVAVVKTMHAQGESLGAICRAMQGVPLRGKGWHPEKVSRMVQS